MATRALIGKLNPDQTVTYISCHYDGDELGGMLGRHYKKPEQVDALLALGDLWSLSSTLEATDPQHQGKGERVGPFQAKNEGVFRGDAMKSGGAEYAYLYQDGQWEGTGAGSWSCDGEEDEDDEEDATNTPHALTKKEWREVAEFLHRQGTFDSVEDFLDLSPFYYAVRFSHTADMSRGWYVGDLYLVQEPIYEHEGQYVPAGTLVLARDADGKLIEFNQDKPTPVPGAEDVS